MKIKIFYILIIGIFILLLGTFIFAGVVMLKVRTGSSEYKNDDNRTVYVKKNENGFQLIRNGKPFYIKGAAGKPHIKELAEAGGNTIRLFNTINLSKHLDEAALYDLNVIVDIPFPKYSKEFNMYDNEE